MLIKAIHLLEKCRQKYQKKTKMQMCTKQLMNIKWIENVKTLMQGIAFVDNSASNNNSNRHRQQKNCTR